MLDCEKKTTVFYLNLCSLSNGNISKKGTRQKVTHIDKGRTNHKKMSFNTLQGIV